MKIFSFLATLLLSVSFMPTVMASPTEKQVNDFLHIMNDEQEGNYKATVNVDAPGMSAHIKGNVDYDADQNSAFGDISLNADIQLTSEDVIGISAKGKVYMTETEGLMNAENIEFSGNEEMVDAIVSGMPKIQEDVWFPIPDYESIIQDIIGGINEGKIAEENIKSLRVKERKKYTQYRFITEQGGAVSKGVVKAYTTGKYNASFKTESADDFIKMKIIFTPKLVTNVRPY